MKLHTIRINYDFQLSTPCCVMSYSVFDSYMMRVCEYVFCSLTCFVCLSAYTYDSKSTAGVPSSRALYSYPSTTHHSYVLSTLREG